VHRAKLGKEGRIIITLGTDRKYQEFTSKRREDIDMVKIAIKKNKYLWIKERFDLGEHDKFVFDWLYERMVTWVLTTMKHVY
jgi:hypothetical protein